MARTCPSCGASIPPELDGKLRRGTGAYCESCGAWLGPGKEPAGFLSGGPPRTIPFREATHDDVKRLLEQRTSWSKGLVGSFERAALSAECPGCGYLFEPSVAMDALRGTGRLVCPACGHEVNAKDYFVDLH